MLSILNPILLSGCCTPSERFRNKITTSPRVLLLFNFCSRYQYWEMCSSGPRVDKSRGSHSIALAATVKSRSCGDLAGISCARDHWCSPAEKLSCMQASQSRQDPLAGHISSWQSFQEALAAAQWAESVCEVSLGWERWEVSQWD